MWRVSLTNTEESITNNHKPMRKTILTLTAATALLASCNMGGSDIQYFPFQTEEDSEWGLISPNGKVLFQEEFKESPTVVKHDRFWVQNKNQEWELYTAEEKPQRVGKRYEQACGFNAEVAPVVKKDAKKIDFINTDGEVVFTISKFGGKPVVACSNFNEGYAVVMNTKYYGVINTKGETVIEPDYAAIGLPSDGKIVAIHKKYEEKPDEGNYTVLALNGETISTFSAKKMEIIVPVFVDGKLIAAERKDGERVGMGIIDAQGEWVLKPSKKIKSIDDLKGGNLIYYDGDNYGVMSLEGNVVIRPKYASLAFADESGKLLFAKKNNGDDEYKLIDLEDNQVGNDRWRDFLMFRSNNTFVKDSKKSWTIINTRGEEQEKEADIYNVSSYAGNEGIYISENVEMKTEVAVDSVAVDDTDYGELESPPMIEDEEETSLATYSTSGNIVFTGILNVDDVVFNLDAYNGVCSGYFYNSKLNLTMQVSGTVSSDCLDVYSTDQKTRWHFYASQSGSKFKGTASNGSASYSMTLTRN